MTIWDWLFEPYKKIIDKQQLIEDKKQQLILANPNLEQLTAGMTRYEGFKKLIDYLHLQRAIELGARECFFSEWLLKNTQLEFLYDVDIDECPNSKILEDRHKYRYKFIRKDAILTADMFPDNYFDFVHLDDCHKYPHVKKELPKWYRKVKKNCVFSGDDYMTYTCNLEGSFGAKAALDEFVAKHNLQFYLIGHPSSNMKELSDYGDYQGEQLTRKVRGLSHEFKEVPNWFILKTKEISV